MGPGRFLGILRTPFFPWDPVVEGGFVDIYVGGAVDPQTGLLTSAGGVAGDVGVGTVYLSGAYGGLV